MECNSACISCLLNHEYARTKDQPSEKLKKQHMLDSARLIASMGQSETAVHMTYLLDNLYNETFHPTENKFVKINHDFNDFVMSMENDIAKKISNSNDPLEKALRYSRLGNYINYGAMTEINTDKFLALFDSADPIDSTNYQNFKKELGSAQNLLLLADNCGEIVLDKILLETIKKLYPNLDIAIMVKGDNVLNDATVADAEQVKVDSVATILNTGCRIAGFDRRYTSKEATKSLENADIILAKGQANFETLFGSGLNIYYSFLCKCDFFAKKFNVEKFEGTFLKEIKQP